MKYKINLLTLKKFDNVHKFIYFALNYLRYILVITLLLTIGVFFYKISADQDIIDTTEAVEQKHEILNVSKPLIAQSQNLNLKIQEIQKIFGKQSDFSRPLEYLMTRFPEGFSLTKLIVEGKSVGFYGKTTRPDLLQIFYARLQKEGKFKQVRLSNIEKNVGTVNFSFSLSEFVN